MSDDLRLAIASALHPRLGAESPLGSLPVDLVRAICELVCVRDILSPMELPLPVLMYPLDASLMYTNLNANGRSRLRFRLTYETSFQYEVEFWLPQPVRNVMGTVRFVTPADDRMCRVMITCFNRSSGSIMFVSKVNAATGKLSQSYEWIEIADGFDQTLCGVRIEVEQQEAI